MRLSSMKALVGLALAITTCVYAVPAPAQKPLTQYDLQATDKDVNEKLNQLHKVIDALQKTVKGLNEGYDQHSKENTEKMKKKFDKLSSVISKLGHQKNELYTENKKLKQEKTALVDKISKLEDELQRQAKAAKNAGAEAWFRNAAQDLKNFLEESGLEHFASPRFSPLIAGIVSNGVVVLPLALTSLFLLRYVKHLTVLRIVMALNLFDLGFTAAIVVSCALLLGDSFEGLRHISEVNFMFIQLVLAAVFWLTCGFLVAAVVQNRKNRGWKYALLELLIRGTVAADYMHRVWSPVMAREDVSVAVPACNYLLYFCASAAAVKLTASAHSCSIAERQAAICREADSDIVSSLVTKHDD